MLTNLLAALDFDSLLWWIDVILKVAVALGTVVFVHELGHFLMAKACGVKVDKFMIGFDIGGYKLAWRWGETLYGIGILPLGGYVKMFGQDDDPSHIAEQMKNSQIDAHSGEAVAKTGPNGETYYIDRRSYLAKSVPQRMAIISAGVIMNVIFAFIFATVAYGIGVKYLPCIVTGTMPGSPAWRAGLQPGDEIVRLGDREDPTFLQLKGGVTLGDLESGIPCEVRRASDGKIVPVTLTPTQEAGELATIGISGPQTLELRKDFPVLEDSAAASAKLVSPTSPTGDAKNARAKSEGEKKGKDPTKLQGGDVIVRVNGVPVQEYRQYAAELAKRSDEKLTIEVRRQLEKLDAAGEADSKSKSTPTQMLMFEVAPQSLRDLGLVMKMGPITALQEDSPAEKAGIKPGDRIESVNGKVVADTYENSDSWTPLTLPAYLQNAAIEGREVEFVIRRGADGERPGEQLTFTIMPVVSSDIEFPLGSPMASDSVGLAYRVENEVHAVVPSGAAEAAGIQAGDLITSAKVTFPKLKSGKTPDPQVVELGREHPNWPALIDALQFAPTGTTVEVVVRRGEKEIAIKKRLAPQPVEGQYVAARGMVFEPVFRTRQAASFAEAVRYGWDETTDSLLMVFRFLQKLGRQVPFKMLGGPGTIAVAAGDAASQGFSSLLVFLTMLSANLAVINFLPIPVLDGGHMVFLLYEGVRGRPANEKFVMAMHMAGFAFILSLMVFVIGLDIQRFL